MERQKNHKLLSTEHTTRQITLGVINYQEELHSHLLPFWQKINTILRHFLIKAGNKTARSFHSNKYLPISHQITVIRNQLRLNDIIFRCRKIFF